jgi:hypothetical protein
VYSGDHDEDNEVLAAPDEPVPAQDEQQPIQAAVEEQAASTDQESSSAAPLLSRVDLLTAAIKLRPEAPVNYILRGEALAEAGDYSLAEEDFRKGLELAEAQAETADWGYIYRALADRAREGLHRIRR